MSSRIDNILNLSSKLAADAKALADETLAHRKEIEETISAVTTLEARTAMLSEIEKSIELRKAEVRDLASKAAAATAQINKIKAALSA